MGAPLGNENAKDSGAPDGNFNAISTGEHVAADRWIEFIEDHAGDELEDMFKSYVSRFEDRGADPVEAVRLSVLWTKADYNNMELIKSDFKRAEFDDEGMYIHDAFDSERDSAATQNEREARLNRRENELSAYSRSNAEVGEHAKSIAEILSEPDNSEDEESD